MAEPLFVDSVHAAEKLGVSPDVILDWIASGKLKRYGGRSDNPFLRRADVAAVAGDLGISQAETPGRRIKSASARVQTRLTADVRWSDIAESDIREWAQRADAARRHAGRTAAQGALERLEQVVRALDEAERSNP